MKKFIAMMLAVLMLLGLAACGSDEEGGENLVITRAAADNNETEAPAEEEAQSGTGHSGPYAFVSEGVELVPGDDFDASQLPKAASVYEVPSCAIEGTDNVYNYETYEITAFDDGTGEVIYSIYLIDPNITTPEGLALGDEAAKVVELYGEGYEADGNAWVYTSEGTMLCIILQNDAVASIEYRMVTE